METLTDLEAAALGCVARERSCTAYALRAHFRRSLASRFSDSAGSVYPMVARLARRGLLRAREEPQGRRRATVYECTPAGLSALRRWMAVPDEPEGLATWDPLRTRALHLGLLSARDRRRWIEGARQALVEHRGRVERALEAAPDRWTRLAHRNALLQADARERWLAELAAGD